MLAKSLPGRIKVGKNIKKKKIMNVRKCRRGKEGEKVNRCSLKVSREQESMRPVNSEDPGLILAESLQMRAFPGKMEKLDPAPRTPRPIKPYVQANLGSDFGNISVEAVWTESVPRWLVELLLSCNYQGIIYIT